MARVEGVGELDWDTNNKRAGLNLILTLDSPIVEEGKINECATWDPNSSIRSVKTLGVRVDIKTDDEFELGMPLMLPREIRYGLHMLSVLYKPCKQIAYSWRGGPRVEICMMGYSPLVPRTKALLRAWANRLSELALGMHGQEAIDRRAMELMRVDKNNPLMSQDRIDDILSRVHRKMEQLGL